MTDEDFKAITKADVESLQAQNDDLTRWASGEYTGGYAKFGY